MYERQEKQVDYFNKRQFISRDGIVCSLHDLECNHCVAADYCDRTGGQRAASLILTTQLVSPNIGSYFVRYAIFAGYVLCRCRNLEMAQV